MSKEYTKAEKILIKKLKLAGKELTGEETPDELNTLSLALEQEEAVAPSEAVEEDGIPNKLPVRFEEIQIAGKPAKLSIYFVAAVKGGKMALYAHTGQRVSQAYGPDEMYDAESTVKGVSYIQKAAAKFNAMRRKNIIPGEAQIG